MIHEDGTLDVCYEGYVFRLQLVATPEIEAAQLGMYISLCVCVCFIVYIRFFGDILTEMAMRNFRKSPIFLKYIDIPSHFFFLYLFFLPNLLSHTHT